MRADLAWPTSGKGQGYHTHTRPILSALLKLATCQARGAMASWPADDHQTGCVGPLDNHHSPTIVQLTGTGPPTADTHIRLQSRILDR